MQKILAFFRRSRANSVPIVMAAGSAGGTAMVTTSHAFKMISQRSTLYFTKVWIEKQKPAVAMTAMTPTNLNESAYILNEAGFGKRMERTSFPLAVLQREEAKAGHQKTSLRENIRGIRATHVRSKEEQTVSNMSEAKKNKP
jgi:hypothetical protein